MTLLSLRQGFATRKWRTRKPLRPLRRRAEDLFVDGTADVHPERAEKIRPERLLWMDVRPGDGVIGGGVSARTRLRHEAVGLRRGIRHEVVIRLEVLAGGRRICRSRRRRNERRQIQNS